MITMHQTKFIFVNVTNVITIVKLLLPEIIQMSACRVIILYFDLFKEEYMKKSQLLLHIHIRDFGLNDSVFVVSPYIVTRSWESLAYNEPYI